MKKILFSLAILAGSVTLSAQTVLFEDDFDSYQDFIIDGIGNWITIDVDQATTYSYSGENTDYPNSHAPKAWQIFNPSTALNITSDDGEVWEPNSGSKYAIAWASVDVQNNDWLISPAITLGASENVLEFHVAALSDVYGPEPYTLHIYSGSGLPDVGDFTWFDQSEISGSEGWRKDEYSLDAYAGQTIRVAIQYTGDDYYALKLDDFKVTTGGLSVSDVDTKVSSVYPNPVVDTFHVNLSSKFSSANVTVTVTDLAGRAVKTFGAAGSYNVSNLAKGVYIVTITDGKNTETKKIVKK